MNITGNFLSALSKHAKADPDREFNDEIGQTFIKGVNSVLSAIRKHLDGEGGEVQSDDEMMQTIMNLFGTFLSGMTNKIENGELQFVSDNELQRVFLNILNSILQGLVKTLQMVKSSCQLATIMR